PLSRSANSTAATSVEENSVGEAPMASLPVAKVIASSGLAFVLASPLPSAPTRTHEFRGQSERVADSSAPIRISIGRFREEKALNADTQRSSQKWDTQGPHAISAF